MAITSMARSCGHGAAIGMTGIPPATGLQPCRAQARPSLLLPATKFPNGILPYIGNSEGALTNVGQKISTVVVQRGSSYV
jgi:hypothetical protein